LYVCPSFSEELQRHLIFRDNLIKNEKYRKEYARIKKEIESETKDERKSYSEIKETRARDFVEGVIKEGAHNMLLKLTPKPLCG
jgi:GrpB-like predicted nucleotidyltransferase (UPF0157 family)